MNLINGKDISVEIKTEIANEVRKIMDNGGRLPHLAAVLVGNDGASETYVASKERACKEVGFTSSVYRLSENISEEELLKTIDFLNNDDDIDGFIVQLPLPKHIDTDKVMLTINPAKDVDGIHPTNIGRMVMGQACYLPATPYGILQLLERSGIETSGKDCVIVGRSNIVGTPMSILMSRKNANATVTLCHSKTQNIAEKCRQADILIVALGQPEFAKEDMVKEGAVVIDVGIHRIADSTASKGYRIVGDVDFAKVAPKCSYITPVPGGVGPMTIVSLLKNTFSAAKRNIYQERR